MNSSRGSYLLGATATALFAIILLALASQYISLALARQALRSASTKLVRCLTTTAGGCLLPASERDPNVEWYLQRLAPRTLHWQERSRFTGAVVEQEWELRGESRETLVTPTPPLQWSGSSLPLFTLHGRLNRYERRAIQVEVVGTQETERQGVGLRPRTEPNFPLFDEPFERRVDRLPHSDWHPLVAAEGNQPAAAPFAFTADTPPAQAIAAGSTASFTSSLVHVPPLPAEVACLTRSGAPCAAATGVHDIRRFASIAIKAFAEITNSTEVDVRWGDHSRGAGLEVTVWSAADVALAKRTDSPLPERVATCLGGRDWTPLNPGGTTHFHLWLRGPTGSHGGTAALCPGGRATHGPIEVERGGAFQIRARISSRRGAVEASVRLAHFIEQFETYETTARSTEPVRCFREWTLRRGDTPPVCPATTVCPFDRTTRITSCNVSVNPIPGCWENAETDPELFQTESGSCTAEQRLTSCAEVPIPKRPPQCTPPSGRVVCGWEAEQSRVRLVTPTAARQCSTATPVVHTLHCTPDDLKRIFRSDGNYGDTNLCGGLGERLQSINAEAAQLEREHGISFNRLDPSGLRWDNEAAARAATWIPFNEVPEPQSIPTTSQRTVVTTFPLKAPLLRRVDANYQPPLSMFATPDARVAHLTPVLIRERRIPLSPRSPFLSAPFELSALCATSAAALQEQLRGLALREFPVLRDPTIYFESDIQPYDSVVKSLQGGCDQQAFLNEHPRCLGEHLVSLEPEECGTPIFLGRFPRSRFPSEPPPCKRPNVRCFARESSSQSTEGSLALDSNRVRDTVRAELARALGDSIDECGECLEVVVDRANWPDIGVTLRLRYQLPLSLGSFFPAPSALLTVEARGRYEIGSQLMVATDE